MAARNQDLFDLAGRHALVTGSSRGLGLALAAGLAKAGVSVTLNGRDLGDLERAAAHLRSRGLRIAHLACFDVTVEEQVDHGIGDLEQRVGPLDILVNNAGLQRRAPITEFATQDWDELIALNLTGVFLVTRSVARLMATRGRGAIINIASVQSRLVRPGIAAYSATKGGVVQFTAGLAADLGRHGIRVNAIAPGYFATDMTRPLVQDADFTSWVAAHTPLGRWGEPEELVGALQFLVSDAASFVTGQTLYVDGGISQVL